MKKIKVSRYVTRAGLKKYRTDIFRYAPAVIKRKTDSTNVRLKALAEKGSVEGTLFISRTQTKGKGRMGRKFFSPKGNGLYFSLLLRPNLRAEEGGLITTATAVAVIRTLARFGAENPQIKWVNDIFVQEKKVCGILTESYVEKGKIIYAVLGVGINLLPPKKGFHPSIKNVAGSAFSTPVSPDVVLATFLEEFGSLYPNLSSRPHFEEYANNLLYVGKQITLLTASGETRGTLLGLTKDFSINVRLTSGEERTFSQGEISLRPMP